MSPKPDPDYPGSTRDTAGLIQMEVDGESGWDPGESSCSVAGQILRSDGFTAQPQVQSAQRLGVGGRGRLGFPGRPAD